MSIKDVCINYCRKSNDVSSIYIIFMIVSFLILLLLLLLFIILFQFGLREEKNFTFQMRTFFHADLYIFIYFF